MFTYFDQFRRECNAYGGCDNASKSRLGRKMNEIRNEFEDQNNAIFRQVTVGFHIKFANFMLLKAMRTEYSIPFYYYTGCQGKRVLPSSIRIHPKPAAKCASITALRWMLNIIIAFHYFSSKIFGHNYFFVYMIPLNFDIFYLNYLDLIYAMETAF